MRLARACAGWALTAAGTVGLTVTAAAQTPRDLSVLPSSTQPAASAAAPVDGSFSRLIELRVELAWLADADTFPYELAAHGTGTALEVGGMVPSEIVRERALQVARTHSMQPVVDRLIVIPGVGNPPTRRGDADLCRAASENLSKMLSGHNEPFQVAADPNGQISLMGTVPSCEDKLHISRRMSQLPGCTAVVNSMVVARVTTKDGQVYTPLSADGRILVTGDPLDLLPPPAAILPTSPVVVQGSGASFASPGQGGSAEAQGYPMTAATVGVVSMEPSYPQGMPMPVVDGYVQPVAGQQIVEAPANMQRLTPMPNQCTVCQTAKQVPDKDWRWLRKAPAKSGAAQAQGQGQRPMSPYAAYPVNNYVPPGPAGSPYAAVYTRPAPASQPNPLPSALAAAPTLAQPMPAAFTALKNGPIQYASAVQTGSKSAVQQVAATVPAKSSTPAKLPQATAPGTGVKPTTAEVAKPLTPNQVHIKRLIEVACGDQARDVELKPMGGNRLVVSLRVRGAGEGQRLGERILAMPELEPYEVSIGMEVKP